ncbi:MAG: isochorismatase family protein [Candidatus Woesearchaeota archaeon]|jgi:isochorismate hydrolase
MLQNFSYPRTLDAFLLRERPIVTIVDMQDEFLSNLSSEDVERMVDNQLRVLDRCRDASLSVGVLEYDRLGTTLSSLKRAVNKIHSSRYFIKVHDDGFSDDQFRRWMKGTKDQPVLLMGVNASACLVITAYSGYGYGHKPVTAECLIGDEFGLTRLLRTGAWFERYGSYFCDRSIPARELVASVSY